MRPVWQTALLALAWIGAILGSARPVLAQTAWQGRGYITLNGGYQPSSTTFSESLRPRQFAEEGSFNTDYEVKAGPSFDLGSAVRLWRDLGVGGSVSLYSDDGSIPFRASVPHPFFFDRHREVTGAAAAERREIGVHIGAVYMIPASSRFRIAIFGGPSFFNVEQTFVTDLTLIETYPYDTVQLDRPVLSTKQENRTGFNIGTDVIVQLGSHFGVGGLIRFSRATVDFAPAEGREVSVDVGGVQTSAGLRVLF